ncbi:hypothetical protein CTAYLR_004060 [Chrysophaeum taylorii]|uniref:Methyltransferase small domain-containing protein n=1 Tax=Chrysophaeum taylorii TaxID=2483200 RepID=A0AAD7XRD9_9STRA|nr:hypothetical protein CTAYLR_004060 [Chrysophaeum taylorii]
MEGWVPSVEHAGLEAWEKVYEPAEDTFLLLDTLYLDRARLREAALIVEVGPGSGVVATYASKLAPHAWVLAVDVNPAACEVTRATAVENRGRVEVVRGDLISSVAKCDALVFNPPYVTTPPEEVGGTGVEASWAGGVHGRQVIDRFLSMLPGPRLVYLLLSEENKPEEVEGQLAALGYEVHHDDDKKRRRMNACGSRGSGSPETTMMMPLVARTTKLSRLVVVGGGISGLAAVDAALRCSKAPDEVVLVNDGARVGGHAVTATLPGSGEKVDLGFMVLNDWTYPNLLELYEAYGVETIETDMSFAVDTGEKSWSFQATVAWVLRYAWRSETRQFARDYGAFRVAALELLKDDGLDDTTLATFWAHLPERFVKGWLAPFVRAVWSVAQVSDVGEFPAAPTIRFMNNHGFLDDFGNMLRWRTPRHRSEELCEAIVRRWTSAGKLRVLTAAKARACSMHSVTLEDGTLVTADYVVLTTQAPTQRELLRNGGVSFRANLLNEVRVSRWTASLHRDPRCMPRVEADWSSWNVLPDGRLTYWLSRLQHLTDRAVFLTLDSEEEEEGGPAPLRDVILRTRFEHPVLTPATTIAAKRLKLVSRGTSLQHAGAWMAHGFHEDGVLSARRAVRDVLGDPSIRAARPDARTPLPPTPVTAELSHVDSDNVAFRSRFAMVRFEASHAPRGVVPADHPGLCRGSPSTREPIRNADVRDTFLRETGVYPVGRVDVVAAPRAFSWLAAFNPLTWCLVYDELDGAKVIGHLVEVHNTPYGEAVVYGWLGTAHRAPKKMHVSPAHAPPNNEGEDEDDNNKFFYEFQVGEASSKTLTVRLVQEQRKRRRVVIFATTMKLAADERWWLLHKLGSPIAFAEVYARMFYRVVATRRRPFFSYTPSAATAAAGGGVTARVCRATLFATLAVCAARPSVHQLRLVALWALATLATVSREWRIDILLISQGLFGAALKASPKPRTALVQLGAHLALGASPLSRSTRIAADAMLLLTPYLVNTRLLAGWTLFWLAARLAVVARSEHVAAVAAPRRVGYRHDRDLDAHKRAMTVLGLVHAIAMTLFAVFHASKIFHKTARVPFDDQSVAIANDAFRGYVAHDVVFGAVVLGPAERPFLQYTPLIFAHHVIFWLASFVNARFKIYSHDFVYLVSGEFSTVFLYLHSLYPANVPVFLAFVLTFGLSRVLLLSFGFAFATYWRFPAYLRASNSGSVPAFAVWLTPFTILLAIATNAYWFASLWRKCWDRVLPRYACRLVEDFLGRRGLARRVDVKYPRRATSLVLARGDVGLGEGYVEEAWTTRTTDDLARVLRATARAYGDLTDATSLVGRLCTRAVEATFSFDTVEGRKASISAHYDRDEDLFKHMLGNTMVYTSALWRKTTTTTTSTKPEPEGTEDWWSRGDEDGDLDRAQHRKVLRVIELGAGAPGKRLLDLGCGYGELVREAALRGLRAVGLTNSTLMQAGAMDRLQGLDATVVLGDMLVPPTDLGRFDIVTCVEAIEALHFDQYRSFAHSVADHLKPRGRAVFQIIHGYASRNPSIRQKAHRPPSTFVQTYIFPDQQLPYLEHVYDEFRSAGLRCVYSEATGLDYARTLRAWRHNLDAMPVSAASARTRRVFEFYLAWCEAGFDAGLIDVTRCVFERHD